MRRFSRIAILCLILTMCGFSAFAALQTGLPSGQIIKAVAGKFALAESRLSSAPAGQSTIPSLPTRTFLPSITRIQNRQECRFAVIGDFGTGTQSEAGVAELVRSWSPEFIVTVGDNNYPNGASSTIDSNIGQFYHEYIHPYLGVYGPPGPVPDEDANRFYPALGNHDWQSVGCYGDTCSGPYLDYFTLPGNERYYSFVQGPVAFFVLDSDTNEPDGIASSSRQADWLRTSLAASPGPWNVVVLHHAPYSSFRHGSTQALQWPFREWGAHVVMAGHDHAYERLLVDGVLYFVNGLGGGDRYDVGDPVAGSQVRYNLDYGAMLVEAGTHEMDLRFISTAGELVDSVVLVR
jgi:tartrate-resistant acid phosphatase type 5